ncbi:MAG: SH3 domain-containing protein [Treponema sp.]|nr:SH3 domain-containing protein [Treponema sp.]
MKRYGMGVLMGILVIGFSAAQSPGGTRYVAVKTASLKASAGLLAAEQGTLVYGEPVTVLQDQGKWLEVQAVQSQLRGWIAASSVTSKRIISSGSRTSASAQELALAGKGFSEELEARYRQDDGFDYDRVDAMETHQTPDMVLYQFLADGHLARGE